MLKNAVMLFAVAAVILIVFLPSYTRMQDLKQKNSDYARQYKELKKDHARLKEELRRLREDPDYLERVGREKMGIVKEGEVIYKIVPDEE